MAIDDAPVEPVAPPGGAGVAVAAPGGADAVPVAPPGDDAPPESGMLDVHPERTLWLLAIAHAVNHAQAVLLPLVYLQILDEFHVTLADVAALAAAGALASGLIQLSFAKLTRVVSRRTLLASGGVLFGGGFAAQAFAPTFPSFAALNIASRIGGAPQHPVGNGLLAEQFPEERRGFAISAHISGGNVGTESAPITLGCFDASPTCPCLPPSACEGSRRLQSGRLSVCCMS